MKVSAVTFALTVALISAHIDPYGAEGSGDGLGDAGTAKMLSAVGLGDGMGVPAFVTNTDGFASGVGDADEIYPKIPDLA